MEASPLHFSPDAGLTVVGLLLLLAVPLVVAAVIVALSGWRGLAKAILAGFTVLVLLAVVMLFSWRASTVESQRAPVASTSAPDPDWRHRVEKAIAKVEKVMAAVDSLKAEKEETKAKDGAKKPSPTAPKKPAWVDAPPGLADDAYQMVVTVGPYKTWQECERALDEKLHEGVNEYIETYAEREPDLDPRAVARVSLPRDYVRKSIVKELYCEEIVSRTPAIGSMLQLKVLLAFDRQANAEIQEAVRNVIVAERIRWGGVGLAGLLLALLVIYAYLKTDLATQGVYRGRLRLAAAVMILGVGAAAVLAVAA